MKNLSVLHQDKWMVKSDAYHHFFDGIIIWVRQIIIPHLAKFSAPKRICL